MPRTGPPTSGYQRLSQAADLTDSDSEDDALLPTHQPVTTSTAPSRPYKTRPRSGSAVDIKVINARLEKWADQIATKFKFKHKNGSGDSDAPPLEILYSVFVPPEGMKTVGSGEVEEVEEGMGPPGMITTRERFEEVVESVREAIRRGIDPKLIRQGSSGSYFMRDVEGRTVAVFKPKDEEPYGKLNPKMMKWLHRTLFPCFFGRACLIPNLSYISEAAACLLDRRLKTFMVPYTDVVHLSSKAFHYDYWDRRAFYRRRKPLPPKVGSFQVFLQGYQDANIFLRNNPWPDTTTTSSTFLHRTRTRASHHTSWNTPTLCRPTSSPPSSSTSSDDGNGPSLATSGANSPTPKRFEWTLEVQQSFREELEKLVILDYIMRNTDRGLDNWMIRFDPTTPSSPFSIRPSSPLSANLSPDPQPYAPPPGMSADPNQQSTNKPSIKIGAIDNSLAFPWKHPDQWRSFPFGWLFLPISLIGQPFSQKTRDHFLPILTSSKWWAETQQELKELFMRDGDFKERMWGKQLAVLKGQAWNVVECLKEEGMGPLELTRRGRVAVWDEEMEVPVATPLHTSPSARSAHRLGKSYESTKGGKGSGEGRSPFFSLDDDDEEMDMGVSLAASAPAPITMPPRSKIPSHVRVGRKEDGTRRSSQEAEEGVIPDVKVPIGGLAKNNRRPKPDRSVKSFDTPRAYGYDGASGSSERGGGEMPGFSSDGRSGRRRGSSFVGIFGGNRGEELDDEEGDIGYSALREGERKMRKVIAERVEVVKTKEAVFTWC